MWYCNAIVINTTCVGLISVSHHHFNNLRALFQGHLNIVIMKTVESKVTTIVIVHLTVQEGDLVTMAIFAKSHSLFIKSRFALLENTTLVQHLRP
jgi:hypothetical protein